MNFKKLILFVDLFLVLGILTLISCAKNGEEESAAEVKGIEVVAGNPVKRRMIEFTELNANTTYLRQEIVRATFQGYTEKTFKNIGDNVKPGDILFQIKTKEADAAGNSKIDSGGDQFKGVVKILARTEGVITELNHQTGDFISDGDQLAVIVDPQSLKIMLDVPFQFIKSVNEGSSYAVRLPDGREINARVEKKIPSINPENQTQQFILTADSKVELPANLNVSVKIPLKSSGDAVALPKSALMTNETQSEYWLMKIINDTIAVKLPVQKGLEQGSFVQIKEPLVNLNERFIVEGAYGLPDTAHISIQTNQKKEE